MLLYTCKTGYFLGRIHLRENSMFKEMKSKAKVIILCYFPKIDGFLSGF